jgi:hypothetical protein
MRTVSRIRVECATSATVALALFGCGRSYRPSEPAVALGRAVNATVAHVQVGAVPSSVTVSVRTTGIDGARLRGAKLVPTTNAPCSEGLVFDRLERDGIPAIEGPIAIDGSHDIDLVFDGPEVHQRLETPLAIDLELEGPAGRSCTRALLPFGSNDAGWQSTPTGVGLFASLGARAYPAVSGRIDGARPGVSFEERIGAAFGDNRLFAGLAVDPGRQPPSERFLVLGAGLDRAVYKVSRWTFWLGAGYDVVLDYENTGAPGPLGVRHTLHGPRVTPGIGYTLVDTSLPLRLYPRPIFFRVGLDAPTALWFGTTGAPKATLVSAIALGLTIDL